MQLIPIRTYLNRTITLHLHTSTKHSANLWQIYPVFLLFHVEMLWFITFSMLSVLCCLHFKAIVNHNIHKHIQHNRVNVLENHTLPTIL